MLAGSAVREWGDDRWGYMACGGEADVVAGGEDSTCMLWNVFFFPQETTFYWLCTNEATDGFSCFL